MQKGVIFARSHMDATWHVRPRGSATRTCASACMAQMWWVHILYYYTYGYNTYKPSIEDFTNRYILLTLYTRWSFLFFSVWDYVPFDFFLSQDAWCHVDRRMESVMNGARRCTGREVHPIKDHRTCLKSGLSELISALPQGSYNSPHSTHPMDPRFNHDRPIKIRRTRSNYASLRTQYVDAFEGFIADRTIIN